jgi:hypothetical protein
MTARSTSARRSASEYSRSGLSPQARTSRGVELLSVVLVVEDFEGLALPEAFVEQYY